MVQEISAQNFQSEREPILANNIERNFENRGINSPESRIEQTSAGANGNGITPATLPAIAIAAPIIDDGVVDINTTVNDNNPLTAGDDDLIEKEWVEKAKKIVSETHDDPYMQDEAVSQLQADYINKRYGRQLGSS